MSVIGSTMRYLVLKKIRSEQLRMFTETVSARGTGADEDPQLPYDAEVRVLDDKEVADTRADPEVEEVVPSIPFTLIEPVELPHAAAGAPAVDLWGLDAIGATTSPFDGKGVTVAILDSGIDTDHEAFAGIAFSTANLMDFVADERGKPGSAADANGHGTHVAGTIFGRPVNGQRIGVAPGIERVLIGKVLGPAGGPTEAIYKAINWALDSRADIISMSLGVDFAGTVTRLIEQQGLPPDIAASRALEAYRANVRLFDRLAHLIDGRRDEGRGALLIAASGNASRRQEHPNFTVAVAPPAAADGFISVGAIGRANEVASFSNTGCTLVGPGVGIVSAKRGGGLIAKNGTSMATPHVAGVAALWIQKLFPGTANRPSRWARDVQSHLETSPRKLPGLSRRDVGLGLVQAPKPE